MASLGTNSDNDGLKREDSAIQKKARAVGIGDVSRHVFVCGGTSCCGDVDGEEIWQYFKQRLKETSLVDTQVFRTKVKCLRICQQGPIVLVYPEGVWYRRVDKVVADLIIDEHLKKGKIVESALFARHSLG